MKRFRLKNLGINAKITLIITLCLTGGVVLTLINLYRVTQTFSNELYATQSKLLSNTAIEIDTKLQNIDDMLRDIIHSTQYQQILSSRKDNGRLSTNEYAELYYMTQNLLKKNEINCLTCIDLFHDSWVLGVETEQTGRLTDQAYQEIYADAVDSEGSTTCVTKYCNENHLYFAKAIRRIDYLRLDLLAVAIIRLDLDKLVRSSVRISDYDNLTFVLADQKTDELLYSSTNISLSSTLSLPENNKDWSIETIEGQTYFVTSHAADRLALNYFYLVPYNDIFRSITMAFTSSILYLLLGLVIILVICKLLVNSITKRIDLLANEMDAFAQYTPDMTIPERSSVQDNDGDEIDLLSNHFHEMTQELDDLIQRDYLNQILQRNAQWKALESQINPHFLYNTLNTLNWSAKMSGASDVSEMVEALSKILQAILDKDQDLIPLDQELELVESYILIQEKRFDDRLDYQLRLEDESLGEVPIPKLTLQPLIENAIKYGLDASIDVCKIRLTILRQSETIEIFVQNEGSSFSADIVGKLESGTLESGGHGMALLNIKKRLMIAYEGQARMDLLNRNGMATVNLNIPITNATINKDLYY